MTRGILAAASALLALPHFPADAQQQTLKIRGALSITFPNRQGDNERTYGGLIAAVGAKWTLRLGGFDPNVPLVLCAQWNESPGSCSSGFGNTDKNGNWTLAGTFDDSVAGIWTEWAQSPSGAISNRISFMVGTDHYGGNLRINGGYAGIFHVGQQWTLLFYDQATSAAAFDICTERDGSAATCSPGGGLFKSTRTIAGQFSPVDIGGWAEWLRFSDGTVTNRVAFTVDDAPLDDATCANGTIYAAGPNAGYAAFQRYDGDWRPANPGDYSMVSGRGGGFGNTLEYTGCKGANYVWLEWEYGGFATVAVRAPWGGQTDRGLRMGDTLARFQSLYPAAHHVVSSLYSYWPSDLDIWDSGPLRVAFQNGLAVMMEVYWDAWNYPADDLLESDRNTIGPWETDIAWHKWY